MKNTVIPEQTSNKLSKLPKKIAGRLRGLLQIGHIDDAVFCTLMDAYEVATDANYLADFATGYLYLKSKGVPVGDVISMANQHNRPIRLLWSESRWRQEHERMSDLSTLKKLAETSHIYDLSWLDGVLPGSFPGYVIKTSRRLGMEGLRQRHCIASYDGRIRSETTVILTVFLNRERWTVELIRTGQDDKPVRIGEIKAKLNKAPSSSQREQIHDMLGIDKSSCSVSGTVASEDTERTWKSALRVCIPLLREQGVVELTATFAGGGDSGNLENVCYKTDAGDVKPTGDVTLLKRNVFYRNGRYEASTCHVQESVTDAVESMIYDWLEHTNVDWYNNDGGQGEIEIDLIKERFTGYVDYNLMETETGYSEDASFAELLDASEERSCEQH